MSVKLNRYVFSMVPVLANGFADLSSRRAWQDENEVAQRGKLAELEARVSSLLTRQDLDVATQLQVIQKQQLRITLRILQLMRGVEVMRRAGGKLSPQEQQLLGRVQQLAKTLQTSPLAPNQINGLKAQAQVLTESGRLDPLGPCRTPNLLDPSSLSILHSVKPTVHCPDPSLIKLYVDV